ncbi:MAG: DUF3368 domain-containing protein [Moorea sp. SIO2B7]|nr:DUF3368 domain-containing protein [Moorena sp. SIO2B7]
MIVISDTSPLTNLAAVELLDLLHQLYGKVIIPQGVYQEMVNLDYLVPGALEIQNFSWIETQAVNNQNQVEELQYELDLGESEAIVLTLELDADLLLLDERRGRQVATSLGITKITGLLGVLLEAKQHNLIEKINPIIDKLIAENNFWISSNLYHRLLDLAGELR